MKKFIKHNGFFVFILITLIAITSGLGIYMYVQKEMNKPDDNITNSDKPPQKEPEPDKTAEVKNFDGSYNGDSKLIQLSWSIAENASKVKQVRLVYNTAGDSINVTQFSSYELPIDAYGLPTGNNTFTLRLIMDNDDTIEETVHVKIDYVLSVQQSIEQGDQSTKVTLTYQYDQANPVKVPSILCLGDADCSLTRYVDTTVNEENGRINASSTYEFSWKEVPVAFENFYVRWNFKDDHGSIYQSYDLPVTKGKK